MAACDEKLLPAPQGYGREHKQAERERRARAKARTMHLLGAVKSDSKWEKLHDDELKCLAFSLLVVELMQRSHLVADAVSYVFEDGLDIDFQVEETIRARAEAIISPSAPSEVDDATRDHVLPDAEAA